MQIDFADAAKFEHRFWLQVLGDHARFILGALGPVEKSEIETANYFINTFDRLLGRIDTTDLVHLSKRAEEEAVKIRAYKLRLLEKHLNGNVNIHFGPTFINHMVNEVEEYIRVLEFLKKGEAPPIFHELHHHLLWLLDAVGHAGTIEENMDQAEKRLKEKSAAYTKHFEQFYLKAVEMTGYLRTNLTSFPALDQLNKDVSLEIKLFMIFLEELEEMAISHQVLGTFAPLMADHMYREECYYLTKVAQAGGLAGPECNPGEPRPKR